MILTFLLDDTAISAATRAVMAYADALVEREHRVRIVTTAPAVTWRSSRAEWEYVDAFRQYDAADDDVVIAVTAEALARARELADERAVLLTPLPLAVEEDVFRDENPREHCPLRVLLSGSWNSDLCGIVEGYGAVAHARWFHQNLDLIRVSPWAPSREEPLETVQEFHVALTTAEMTRLMHSCEILIAPNHREEGFGLPAAEAMASGLACVLTSIPSYLSFDETRDYALFAPENNAVELGERLIELLSDEELRDRLRARGREVAEQWRIARVVERLERFFNERATFSQHP
jgi:glycosyltransferase involved in cell wall biosynthesis